MAVGPVHHGGDGEAPGGGGGHWVEGHPEFRNIGAIFSQLVFRLAPKPAGSNCQRTNFVNYWPSATTSASKITKVEGDLATFDINGLGPLVEKNISFAALIAVARLSAVVIVMNTD